MGNRLGHPPPAHRRNAKMRVRWQVRHPVPPQTIEMIRRHVLRHQCLQTERYHAGPGTFVFERHRPETRCRKARLHHNRRANPQGCQYRIGLRIRMEKRQVDKVYVVRRQCLVRRAKLAAPQGVRVGPDNTFGSRRRARRILHPHRQERLHRAQRYRINITIKRRKTGPLDRSLPAAGCLPIIGFRHHKPPKASASLFHKCCKFGLRNSTHHLCIFGIVCKFCQNRTRIRGDSDGTKMCTRIPGQNALRTIVEVNKNPLSLLHTPCLQPRCNLPDIIVKGRIAPGFPFSFKRFPHKERMRTTMLRQSSHMVGDIKAGEWMNGRQGRNSHRKPLCIIKYDETIS